MCVIDMPQTGIAYVPADKQIFTLNEVVELLALARWPEVQGSRVSYPLRFTAPSTRGEVLVDDDKETLTAIWKHAKLPEPTFPLPESEWANYTQVFERSKAKPDWVLGCCVENDALTRGMLRVAAQEQYMAALVDAIRAGNITARDPLTHMPCTDVRVTVGQHDLLLSRADIERFAASAMIEVRNEPGKDTALAKAQRIEARCRELKTQGVTNWLKRVATEEGLSVTRIKQIRSRLKAS